MAYFDFFFSDAIENTKAAETSNPDTNYSGGYGCNYSIPVISHIYFSDFAGVGITARDDLERSYVNNDVYKKITNLNNISPGSIKDIYSLCADNINYTQTASSESNIWTYTHALSFNIFTHSPNATLNLEKLKNRRLKIWLETANHEIYVINSMRIQSYVMEQGSGYTVTMNGVTNEHIRRVENSIFEIQNIV